MTDPDSGSWSYRYDDNSNLTRQTDPDGTQLRFRHDDLDRIDRRQSRDGIGSWTTRARWTYDPAGNLGALAQSRAFNPGEGEVRHNYVYETDTNAAGWLLSETIEIPQADNTGRWDFTTNYTYRENSQRSTISYPADRNGGVGETVTIGYDGNTGLGVGLTSVAHGTLIHGVAWNGAGQPTQRQYGTAGGEGVSSFQYHPTTLRLSRNQAGTTNDPGEWQDLEYRYDRNSNITKIRDRRNSNQRQCFVYGQLDRLTRAWTADSWACNSGSPRGDANYDETYTYEDGGNIATRVGSSYAYGGSQPHAATNIDHGDGTTSTFSYNADGNMETRQVAGQSSQTLTWDPEQRLDTITNEDGQTITNMTVDADGARARVDDGTLTVYYLPGGNQYAVDENGTGEFTYYYTLGGATVALAAEAATEPTFLYTDHIGSTTVSTSNGIASLQRYTPWGEVRTNDGALGTNHTFTGQINDQSTGLAYYNARYYDPTIGRFASADSIVPQVANAQDYNRYSYVRNNPVSFNDPSGHCPERAYDPTCGYSPRIGKKVGEPTPVGKTLVTPPVVEVELVAPQAVTRGHITDADVDAIFEARRVQMSDVQKGQFRDVINGMAVDWQVDTDDELVNLIATVLQETFDWKALTEHKCNETRYAPYCGRGPVHLTWEDSYRNFQGYLEERGYDLPSDWYSNGAFAALTSDADIMVQSTNAWREEKTSNFRGLDPADYLYDFQEFNSFVNRGVPGRTPNGGMKDRCIRLGHVVQALGISQGC